MRHFVYIVIITSLICSGKVSYAGKPSNEIVTEHTGTQLGPIYFLYTVPSKIAMLESIDLSFYKSSLIGSYRYRLEVPRGSGLANIKSLTEWSEWTIDELSRILIPSLDVEGSYRLMIEYKTSSGSIRKFEKVFFVASAPAVNAIAANSRTRPDSESVTPRTTPSSVRTTDQPPPVAERTPTTAAVTTDRVRKQTPATSPVNVKATEASKPGDTTLADGMRDIKLPAVNELKQDITRKDNAAKADDNATIDRNDTEFKSLASAISPAMSFQIKDMTPETNRNLIPYNEEIQSWNEALPVSSRNDKSEALSDSSITDMSGRSVVRVQDTSAGSDKMPDQKTGIEPVVPTDRYGNSPVHLAVLSDDVKLLNSLIDKGADLNIKNTLELSPVHLAAMSGNVSLVQNLVSRGADINIRGNSGYTPLHIAAEVNDVRMAEYLLSAGADKTVRTDQKLTSGQIARIQGNDGMLKLLRQKDSEVSVTLLVSGQKGRSIFDPVSQTQQLDFNLPFDNKLVKKRRFNKVVQLVAVPVFALSAYESFHVKSMADRYYNLSKTAETEELAKYYYDKTTRYDRNLYLTGGISLISAYSYIHSAIRKTNITRKMRKTFY